MVDVANAQSASEFVDYVRSTFKAYVPESDAWAEPNFFSIYATVVGGMAWTAINEARLGFDARANPQTAVGANLDVLAGLPPLNLTRLSSTQASGSISVNIPSLTLIPAGYEFTASDGTVYVALADTPLTGGAGTVDVVSVLAGSNQNSLEGQCFDIADEGEATSLGIIGGRDVECDDDFRLRMFVERAQCYSFGSVCSYLNLLKSYPGITRAWAIEDGLVQKFVFVMEDDDCCGQPTQDQVDEIIEWFQDDCRSTICFCPNFEAACTKSIAPDICWQTCPEDISEVEAALQDWLRASVDLGEGVKICDIEAFLASAFPQYGPSIKCCEDYPPIPCCVYNCVELIGG
jgi:hypothetical protein